MTQQTIFPIGQDSGVLQQFCDSKGPDIRTLSEIKELSDVTSNKIRPKRSSFGVYFESLKQLPKVKFMEKLALAGKHLQTTIGLCQLHYR